VHAYYSGRYVIDLPPGHTFPVGKYVHLHARLRREGVLSAECVHEPEPATRHELLHVHTADYHDRFVAGGLSRREVQRLGLPWSPTLVDRARVSVGGTLGAARRALATGLAANLGGGTHHAFAAHGEGFCVFNDIAVAIRVLQAERRIARAAVVDCDVHQGNGTAAIFAGDPTVYTLSLHAARNYPLFKPPSTIDVAMADRMGDTAYLECLDLELARLFATFDPEILFYQAGVDAYVEDRLGRLALSLAGLRRRDERVLQAAMVRAIPVVITLGGGYARDVADTVEAHCNTFRVARALAP